MRNNKKDDIDKFTKDHKLKVLGVPQFIGSGSHDIEDVKHRFLVMPRYGKDIWKIFLEQNRKFPLHTVYRLGWQLTNVLEYVHNREYVHADIKGANVLLGFNSMENVYLLDYGLAAHYNTKDYKIDPKKAHNGTIEYTSRDAHNGVLTMRGDIEILAYNLIEWAGAKLPWTASSTILQKPIEVQKLKESFMKDTEKALKSAFPSTVPSHLVTFLKYVESIKHNDTPDYKKIRSIFEAGLKELKESNSGKLEFSAASTSKVVNPKIVAAAKSPVKRAHTLTKDSLEKPRKQPKVIASSTESSDDQQVIRTTKRIAQRKRYAEVNSSDDEVVEAEVIKKTDKGSKKAEKSKGTPEKNENKTANRSPPQKKSKDDKKKGSKDSAATSKGSVYLKSSSGSGKKTVELNFDLNISLDTDLIVTVNRKNKKKPSDESPEKTKPSPSNKAGYYKGKYAKTND